MALRTRTYVLFVVSSQVFAARSLAVADDQRPSRIGVDHPPQQLNSVLVQHYCTHESAAAASWWFQTSDSASENTERFFLADEEVGAGSSEHIGQYKSASPVCPRLYSTSSPPSEAGGPPPHDGPQQVSCCPNATDVRLAHDELVHKWQFVNRNYNDRLESYGHFLQQTQHLSEEYCATHLIRSRIQAFETANKLQHQWAALLLATETFVLCATCFPPPAETSEQTSGEVLGSDKTPVPGSTLPVPPSAEDEAGGSSSSSFAVDEPSMEDEDQDVDPATGVVYGGARREASSS